MPHRDIHCVSQNVRCVSGYKPPALFEQEIIKLQYPKYQIIFFYITWESLNYAHGSQTLETFLCLQRVGYFVNNTVRKTNILGLRILVVREYFMG